MSWAELDTEKGLEICEQAEQYGGVSYGRLLHKSGRLNEAAERFEYLYERDVNRTSNGMSTKATYLARMYEMGWGVSQDLEKAEELYESAALRSDSYNLQSETFYPANPRAQHNLASMLYWGVRKESDMKQAASLWEKAGNRFQPQSLANLAWLYRRGFGVRMNIRQSADLYLESIRLLSLREDKPDMLISNEDRYGSKLDLNELDLSWLQEIAERNQREALVTLGYFYHTGKSVPADLETALDFYERAIRLFPHSPEYGAGPAFVDAANSQPSEASPSWVVDRELLEDGIDDEDAFALAFNAISLERRALSSRPADLSKLEEAAEYYSKSGLGNSLIRSSKIYTSIAGAVSEDEKSSASYYEVAERQLLASDPMKSNYGALSDAAAIMFSTGRVREAVHATQWSAKGIKEDFFYPDARPLLMKAIIDDEKGLTTVDSAETRLMMKDARERAIFSRDFQLLDAITDAELYAGKNLAERQKIERKQHEKREFSKKAISLFLFLVMLSGMGEGGQTSGHFMDQTDGMQHAGSLMAMRI
ncbi:MAG: tetratricopeptide repeat protein [Halioglobus sp.]